MLRPDREIERVYLHRAPVDMRKQMDGLSILAKDVIRQDPMSGSMFVFINARPDQATFRIQIPVRCS
jgi:transposase